MRFNRRRHRCTLKHQPYECKISFKDSPYLYYLNFQRKLDLPHKSPRERQNLDNCKHIEFIWERKSSGYWYFQLKWDWKSYRASHYYASSINVKQLCLKNNKMEKKWWNIQWNSMRMLKIENYFPCFRLAFFYRMEKTINKHLT